MDIKSFLKNRRNALMATISNINSKYANVAPPIRDQWIKELAHKLPDKTRVLDVGAGTCPYRELFRHCEYVAHDFKKYHGTKNGPATDKWQYGAIDIISDVESIPVKRASYDAIICTEVFEHIPNPISAIKEFSRILKPKGRLILSAPLASGLHQEPYHFYGGFTPHFYKQFLKEAGFGKIKIIPEGGFFKHLSQENYRASNLLMSGIHRNFLMAMFLKIFLVPTLWKLDDRYNIPEFTVGYLVEAIKK